MLLPCSLLVPRTIGSYELMTFCLFCVSWAVANLWHLVIRQQLATFAVILSFLELRAKIAWIPLIHQFTAQRGTQRYHIYRYLYIHPPTTLFYQPLHQYPWSSYSSEEVKPTVWLCSFHVPTWKSTQGTSITASSTMFMWVNSLSLWREGPSQSRELMKMEVGPVSANGGNPWLHINCLHVSWSRWWTCPWRYRYHGSHLCSVRYSHPGYGFPSLWIPEAGHNSGYRRPYWNWRSLWLWLPDIHPAVL